MNQSTEVSLKNNIKSYPWMLLVILAGILVMLPVYWWGIPIGADLTNHFRFTLPLYDEINSGNFFPGWLAESNFGFGDPRFRFYPPFVYYLLCLFYYLTGDWYLTTLLGFSLFSIIGALGVYFWARGHLSEPVSFLAAAVFTLTPYHLAQFYQASLLAEFAAASLLPFAFLAVEKLLNKQDKNRFSPLLGIGLLGAIYSLIITTHLPTTVIGSLSLGLFALLLTDWKENKKGLVYGALGILLGLLSSSWFWVKMISELGWIQAGQGVSSDYYDYRSNFLFSPFAPPHLKTFYASLIAALTICFLLPSLIIWRRVLWGKESAKVFRVILILALFSLFMTTDLSRPVWALVPKLKDVQFPYRWLTISSILICPLVALSFLIWKDRMTQRNLRVFHWPLLLFFAGGVIFTIYAITIDAEFLSRDTFHLKIYDARGGQSFKDWLPRNAKELKDLEPMKDQVEVSGREVSEIERKSHRFTFSVSSGAETQAHLRTYYYPLWKAHQIKDGQKISLETNQAADGTLLVTIPNESAAIKVEFVDPPRTKISLIVALLGWTITLALLIVGLIKSKSVKNSN